MVAEVEADSLFMQEATVAAMLAQSMSIEVNTGFLILLPTTHSST
jgi:hypothetical protein